MHSFATNCSSPPQGTNYVEAAPIRGTLQILWSSISVLILCTWSVIRLNVPQQIKVTTETQKLQRRLGRLFTKIMYMCLNLLAPEWIIFKSIADRRSVYELRKSFKNQADLDGVPWSDTHTHFANMGGIGISFRHLGQIQHNSDNSIERGPHINLGSAEETSIRGVKETNEIVLEKNDWRERIRQMDTNLPSYRIWDVIEHWHDLFSESNTTRMGYQIDGKHFRLLKDAALLQPPTDLLERDRTGSFPLNLLVLMADIWILDARQLLVARELEIIKKLPNIDLDDLQDRNTDNLFVKAIALSQIFWFALQFLVRAGNGQTNTQLEVMVFAFVICSTAAYILAWDRPNDVQYTVIFDASKHPDSGEELVSIAIQGPDAFIHSNRTLWIPDTVTSQTVGHRGWAAWSLAVCTSIFGAIHCIAWNYEFPSEVDHTVWQIASLMTALFPVISVVLAMLLGLMAWALEFCVLFRNDQTVNRGIIGIILVIFAVIRLAILAEVFRTLGFQPPEAYDTTWTNNLPHIA